MDQDLDSRQALQDSLVAAAKMGDAGAQRLQKALDDGADPLARDSQGRSALHHAAMAGSYACCALLATYGSDIGAADVDGQEPLAFAVLVNSTRCAKLLLDLGADPNCCDVWGSPMLHIAICGGPAREQLLGELVAAGADVQLRDRNGLAPIHWAAVMGMTEAAGQLVSLGADPRALDALGRAPWETCGYDDEGLRSAFKALAAPVAEAPDQARPRERAMAAA